MADYHDNEKRRSKFPDKSRLMSTYVRLDIKFDDEKDMNAKKKTLKEMSNMVAGVVHKDMETDVLLTEGSVIIEIITSGNLHLLLSPENMKAIGVLADNSVESLLNRITIRAALPYLVKDINRIAISLPVCVKYAFRVTQDILMIINAEPGVIGNLKKFFEACDVARNEKLSAQKRKNAMERASNQLKTILDLSENKEDQKLAIKCTDEELERISHIRITNQKNKELKYAQDFNEHLSACRERIKKSGEELRRI